MLEKLNAWYTKYPAAFVAGYVGGLVYPLSSWLPTWVLELGAKIFGA